MVVRRLSWAGVWGRRLARHFLVESAPRDRLVDVVGAVCGIHAQMMPSAEISLGLRIADATRADLRTELWERRSLVKTYGLRGTVHLFPAAELQLWLAALRANPEPKRSRPPELTLAPDRTDAVIEAIADALDGRRLTRDELETEVVRRVGRWAMDPGLPAFGGSWPRWMSAIGPAARRGVLCFGPPQQARVTYVRVDQWVGAPEPVNGEPVGGEPVGGQPVGIVPVDGEPVDGQPVDGETALAEVVRRFLTGYGPATHLEFARWFSTDEKAAKQLLHSLGDELEEVDVDGWHAWLPAADEPAAQAGGSVRLLPHFDCYVVGAHPRDRFMHPKWTERGLTQGTAATLPVLLVDGVVGGVWQRRRSGRRVEITVEPFGLLTARQRRQVEAEAARIGEIVEASVMLIFDTVQARPHL